MAAFTSLKSRLPEALALSLVLAPHSQSSSPMRSNTSQRDDVNDAENSNPGPSLNSPISRIKPILLDHFPSIASRIFNRHCRVFFYEIRVKGYGFSSRESKIQVEEHRAVSNQHSQGRRSINSLVEKFVSVISTERAWSIDFSRLDPMKLASGSDDCTVRIWSINERNSLCSIRNMGNVCCVQYSAHSSHLLAFGSADYKIYCYDLRNVDMPWCVLAGHSE